MRSLEHALVILFLAIAFGLNLQRVPFHPDESSWIGSSAVFEELLRGNFASEVWDPGNWQQGTVGMEPYVPITTNSTITRDLIGIGRRLGRLHRGRPEQDMGLWQDGSTERLGRPKALSRSTQLVPSSHGCLGRCIHLFALCVGTQLIWEKSPAYLLVLCFALGTFFLQSLGRAMDEAPLLAGITLTILAAKKYLEGRRQPPEAAAMACPPQRRHRIQLWRKAHRLLDSPGRCCGRGLACRGRRSVACRREARVGGSSSRDADRWRISHLPLAEPLLVDPSRPRAAGHARIQELARGGAI